MNGTANSNERIGRGVDTDFTGWKSADGFVTIINRKEGRSYIWVAQCSKPGCFCSGITFSHEYLVGNGVIKCASSAHDSASAEPVARRTYEAGVQERLRDDAVLSPRQRAEQVASTAEREAFEKAQEGAAMRIGANNTTGRSARNRREGDSTFLEWQQAYQAEQDAAKAAADAAQAAVEANDPVAIYAATANAEAEHNRQLVLSGVLSGRIPQPVRHNRETAVHRSAGTSRHGSVHG